MIANRFEGRQLLPQQSAYYAKRVEEQMVVPDSGLYVIFESKEILWPGQVQIEPFTVSHTRLQQDGPENGTPAGIPEYFRHSGWVSLVWIPAKFVLGDTQRFIIRYAHELQHYVQHRDHSNLSSARAFLMQRRRQGHDPTIEVERDRSEFNAHIVSLEMFERLFGKGKLDCFIEGESEDPAMRHFYSVLISLRREWKAYCGT